MSQQVLDSGHKKNTIRRKHYGRYTAREHSLSASRTSSHGNPICNVVLIIYGTFLKRIHYYINFIILLLIIIITIIIEVKFKTTTI